MHEPVFSTPPLTRIARMTDAELTAAGVGADLVRLSVGIENAEDIIDDLRQALEQC